MWTASKVFTEFVTILLMFYVVCFGFWPQGIWDLISPARDRTRTPPALEGEVLTTGLPGKSLFFL